MVAMAVNSNFDFSNPWISRSIYSVPLSSRYRSSPVAYKNYNYIITISNFTSHDLFLSMESMLFSYKKSQRLRNTIIYLLAQHFEQSVCVLKEKHSKSYSNYLADNTYLYEIVKQTSLN